jgi:SCF-associated factor 1
MASDKPAGLQGRSVTSVKTGDYHSLALTTEGSCYSWGENAAGQLGLGDDIATWSVRESIHTDEPTLIRFGRGDEDTCLSKERDPVGDFFPSHSKRRFVFSIAAAGWHSGALVVDVEGGPRAVGEAEATTSRVDDRAAVAANDGAPSNSNDIERSDQTRPRDGQSATTRFMPFIRFGHAAGRGLVARAESTQAPAEPAEPARHLPFIRIGFAGRGANRDGPGVQRQWRARTEAEREDHPPGGAPEP